MQEKTMYGNGEVTLAFLNKNSVQERISNATTVHCFPIKDGQVLFTLNPRGIDIIGGHIESGETAIETLFREAMEEASIIPIEYEIIGGIEVDNSNNPEALSKGYPLKGCQLFYVITEFELKKFNASHECTGRIFLSPEDVPGKHHKWLKTHQVILNEAVNFSKNVRNFKIT